MFLSKLVIIFAISKCKVNPSELSVRIGLIKAFNILIFAFHSWMLFDSLKAEGVNNLSLRDLICLTMSPPFKMSLFYKLVLILHVPCLLAGSYTILLIFISKILRVNPVRKYPVIFLH